MSLTQCLRDNYAVSTCRVRTAYSSTRKLSLRHRYPFVPMLLTYAGIIVATSTKIARISQQPKRASRRVGRTMSPGMMRWTTTAATATHLAALRRRRSGGWRGLRNYTQSTRSITGLTRADSARVLGQTLSLRVSLLMRLQAPPRAGRGPLGRQKRERLGGRRSGERRRSNQQRRRNQQRRFNQRRGNLMLLW